MEGGLRRFLQVASLKREASGLDPEAVHLFLFLLAENTVIAPRLLIPTALEASQKRTARESWTGRLTGKSGPDDVRALTTGLSHDCAHLPVPIPSIRSFNQKITLADNEIYAL